MGLESKVPNVFPLQVPLHRRACHERAIRRKTDDIAEDNKNCKFIFVRGLDIEDMHNADGVTGMQIEGQLCISG